MNHRNYLAYRLSKRKKVEIKNFDDIFKHLDYAYSIIEEEKEIYFTDRTGKTLLKLKYQEGWFVTVENVDDLLKKWQIIKSHLGYINPLFFIDDNEKVLAYVHGCWLVH